MTRTRVRAWWQPAAMAVALLVLSTSPERVDAWYSRFAYPWIQRVGTTLSNLTSFAWLDPLVLGAVALALWRLWRLISLARTAGLAPALGQFARRVVRFGGWAALIFLIAWGLNYRRVPLDVSLGTPASDTGTTEELRSVMVTASALAARVRPYAATHEVSYDEAADLLRVPFGRALTTVNRPPLVVFGRPKFTLFTPYFTWAGIDGMSNPFGLESIVQPAVLPFERPFVLAHEWAHLAGQADEAEASAVGWLACMSADDTLAYSGTIYLIVELSDALPRSDWRELSEDLDPGVKDDLRAMAKRFERTQPVVRQTASRVYDSYLRANGVSDGVRSYSRALSIILLPRFRVFLEQYPAAPDRQR